MKHKLFASISMILVLFICAIMISGFSGFQEKKPWVVPDAAKSKKNPVASDATSINAGKALWAMHCKSCHGGKGMGDGPKAAQLKTEPGDFTKAETQAESDGSLFYKTSEGHEDMPSFKKKIPDEDDIWSLVNYMRTLKK